jgi:hypothetical protein
MPVKRYIYASLEEQVVHISQNFKHWRQLNIILDWIVLLLA